MQSVLMETAVFNFYLSQLQQIRGYSLFNACTMTQKKYTRIHISLIKTNNSPPKQGAVIFIYITFSLYFNSETNFLILASPSSMSASLSE